MDTREGRFRVERLLFHLAGVPTYIVVAELAVHVVLHGELPSPGGYPDRLRAAAHPPGWRTRGVPSAMREPWTRRRT